MPGRWISINLPMAWGSSAAFRIVLQHPWGFGFSSPILFASISMQFLHAFIAEPFPTLEQTDPAAAALRTEPLMSGLKRLWSPCLALPCLQHPLPQGADQVTGFAALGQGTSSRGSALRIRAFHPIGQLILPSEVDACVLARQEQPHTHVEDAGGLQGRDGGATAVLAEVMLLVGVVDRQSFLADRRDLPQQLLLADGSIPPEFSGHRRNTSQRLFQLEPLQHLAAFSTSTWMRASISCGNDESTSTSISIPC
jgi:hypothetical protein